jgi:hypothetical protein
MHGSRAVIQLKILVDAKMFEIYASPLTKMAVLLLDAMNSPSYLAVGAMKLQVFNTFSLRIIDIFSLFLCILCNF